MGQRITGGAPLRYTTNCVSLGQADVPALDEMIDNGRPITRGTFLRYVDRDQLAKIEQKLGYGPATCRNGELTMAGDYHVAYYRSRWRGRPCVYFVHSAIEYIWAGI